MITNFMQGPAAQSLTVSRVRLRSKFLPNSPVSAMSSYVKGAPSARTHYSPSIILKLMLPSVQSLIGVLVDLLKSSSYAVEQSHLCLGR